VITLVESNVLLDVVTDDPVWGEVPTPRSSEPRTMDGWRSTQSCTPRSPCFLAGKCLARYRRAGGTRRSPLPDFYVGAHAAVEGLTLLNQHAVARCM